MDIMFICYECIDETIILWLGQQNLLKRYEKTCGNGKGDQKYTKAHPPMEVYYYEVCKDATTARKREYEIKQMNRQDKLKLMDRGKEHVTNNEKKH